MRITKVKWIVVRVLKCLLCILIGKKLDCDEKS